MHGNTWAASAALLESPCLFLSSILRWAPAAPAAAACLAGPPADQAHRGTGEGLLNILSLRGLQQGLPGATLALPLPCLGLPAAWMWAGPQGES